MHGSRKILVIVIPIVLVIIVSSFLIVNKTFDQKTDSSLLTEINTSTAHGLYDLKVGKTPLSAVYNPLNHKTYVADSKLDSVSVIDSDNKIVRTINLDMQPKSMIADPSTNSIIVGGTTSSDQGAVVVISGSSDSVTSRIRTPAAVVAVTYDQDNKDIYAAGSMTTTSSGNGSTVFVIDTSSGSVTSQITVNGTISDIIYDSSNKELYASTMGPAGNITGKLTIIDTSTNHIISNVEVGIAPAGLLSVDGQVYVANSRSSSVSVIADSSNTVVETIPVNIDPVDLAFDPMNKELYVADMSSGELSIINTTSLSFEGTINLGHTPISITYDSSNNELYIVDESNIAVSGSINEGLVTVIPVDDIPNLVADVSISNNQTNSTIDVELEAEVHVGGSPTAIAYDPSNNMIYTADSASNTASVIDAVTDKVIDNIPVGLDPTAIVYDPDNSNIYVADTGANSVVEISANNNSIVATIDVGLQPSGLAYDPTNGELYVSNSGSDTVSVINTSSKTVITTIDVGVNPTSIAYDPLNENIYVTDSGSANEPSNIVSVIDTDTNTVVQNITVGLDPTFVTVDTNNGDIFVAAQAGTIVNGGVEVPTGNTLVESPVSVNSDVYIINPENNDVVADVSIGTGEVSSMTFDPVANEVIAVDPEANTIIFIDAETDSVSQTVEITGETPTAVGYDEDNNTIITASASTDEVTVLAVTTTTSLP